MQLLSRHQLLSLEEPELRGLAECHGLDGLDELLDGFRAMAGEG